MVDDEFPALIEQLEVVSGQITHMTQHADAGGGGGMTFWQAAHGMATIRGDGLSDVLDQTIEPGQHTVVCHFRRDTDLCEGVRPSVRLELDVPGARDGVPPRPCGRAGCMCQPPTALTEGPGGLRAPPPRCRLPTLALFRTPCIGASASPPKRAATTNF